ncbi:glycoside hydrolase [Puteibacter caeruleilacunae]|nr:glycoside hydrolase [Puteibacter caeruleilacunae]
MNKTITFLLLFLSGVTLMAQSTGDKGAKAQRAQWITHPQFEEGENQWFQLIGTHELKKKPKKAIAKIAADSKYWLWINGELAVFEGQLKRGPNSNDTYYDEIDLSKWLKKGKNTIAVQLWYYGRSGFSHNNSGKAGFFFDCQVGEEKIITDASWKIKRDKAYQRVEKDEPNYRLSERQVKFVATEAIEGWNKTGFDCSGWSCAEAVGVEGCAPWNYLHKRIIPFWKDHGKTVIKASRVGNRVRMKLPYNMQFHFYLKVKAPAGKNIVVTTDNYYTINGGKIIRGEYVTKEGVQEYEHLPWMSGHEVYFDVEDGVEVMEVGYRETGYDSEFDGVLKYDDKDLMVLLEKAKRTLYVTMRDNYMDCPDRERAQWWGDLVLEMEESFYAMDADALPLARKAIYELVDWQNDKGVLHSPIPGNYPKELPQQMLASVGWFGFRHFVQYTGDLELYKKVYPHVKRYLSLWTVGEDGTVPFKKGGWNWSDWGKQIDKNLLEQVWYYLALKGYAEMAEYMNEPAVHKDALDKMMRIKKRLNTVFWTKEGYRSPGYKDEIDDRGNGLAVVAGIADKSKYPVLKDLLFNIRHASPYMEKYVDEALFMMGESELALRRIKERYKMMIDDETTTLWEIFAKKNSLNHAWSGGPLSLMYKYIAGIQPTKPGFEEFAVFPDVAGKDNVECSFSSVKGNINMTYEKEESSVKFTIEVPKGAAAIIRIPLSSEHLRLKGKGKADLLADRTDLSYKYYRLSSGNWLISHN